MHQLWTFFENIAKQFRIWMIIAPWEQAVRIRLGKRVKLLAAGVHFVLPLTDRVYTQAIRVRLLDLGRHTVSSADGCEITISGSVRYQIDNLLRLYQTLHQPEETLRNYVSSAIADYISSHNKNACSLSAIKEAVSKVISQDFQNFGLTDIEICLTELVRVKTYRFMTTDAPAYLSGELSTQNQVLY